MLDSGGATKPAYWHWFAIVGVVVGVALVVLPAMVSAVAVEPIKPSVTLTRAEPSPPPPEPTLSTGELANLVSQFANRQSVPFGIYVMDLKTGQSATNLADKEYIAASLYKLFVAEGVLSNVDNGKSKLTSSQEICLRAMLTVSDNGCGRILGQTLGWGDYNKRLIELGYTNTKLDQNNITTTAADVAKFYRKLYEGKLLSGANNQKLISLLKDQRVTNRLPRGLPTGTEIAHKTGDLSGYMHDAGIVYGPKTDYLVVALSGPWGKSGQSFPAFEQLSRELYDYFNR